MREMNPRLILVGIIAVGVMTLMALGVVAPDPGLAFLGGSLLGLPAPRKR